ncbi:MFS transporter [Phenylobacterium sp.]|uniref:MFS transporter n=1 Tax=Phenylobacterium sp. TaxID=1871053 RepID=UPI002F42C389
MTETKPPTPSHAFRPDPGVADPPPREARRPGCRTDHPRLVLTATILASSLAFIDGSVVTVGLPAIGRSLHAGAGDLQWVVNAYLLPLSALLMLGGALGDRFGRSRMLVLGTALFAAASLACALVPSLPGLLLGRMAQGVGAALLMPNSLAILGDVFRGEGRGRAVGIWAAAGAAAGAVGPVIGGWLIDTVGWRAIFLINLPLALAAILLAWRYVQDLHDREAPPLDGVGALLATLALGALTWALTVGSGPHGWTGPATAAGVAGVVLAAGFVGVEARRGDRAMAPPSLFGSSTFVGLTLLTFLLYGALGGLMVLLPYLLIQTAGYSGTAAGAALLPFPLVLALASPLMGRLAARIGARPPLALGSMVTAAGFLLALRIGDGACYWTHVLPAVLVIALGMAGAVAPLTTAVLGSVDPRHTGSASGLNSAVARTGGLIATALLGAVLAARGEALVAAFRLAAVAGAAAAAGAGAAAFLLIRPARPERG